MNRTSGLRHARNLLAMAAILAAAAAPARAQDKEIDLDTPQFTLHATMPDANVAHEMAVRLASFGEAYSELAKASGVGIRNPLHVYVHTSHEGYLKSGGKEGSGATLVINENRLIMQVPPGPQQAWGTIGAFTYQLYAGVAYSGHMPMWAYSGLADYFTFARWTGDGVAAGIYPADLIRQVRMDQKEGSAPTLDKMIALNLMHWYSDPGQGERDHKAWAMAQFLLHGDGGKYRPGFTGYLRDTAKGDSPTGAFAKYFGGDTKGFETHYQQWLSSAQADPNAALGAQACVATLTSFLARGQYLKMKFPTAVDFFEAAKAGKVLVDWSKAPALWLPASLLQSNLEEAEKLGTWSLDPKKSPPPLTVTLADGTTCTGSYTMAEGRRPAIKIDWKGPPKGATSKPAAP